MIKKTHIEAVESYVNGNISWFKEYLSKLTKRQLLELLQVWFDYGYKLSKIQWLMDN